MKKHLFLIAGICTAFSMNAQTVVKVVADTDVKVKPNTLFYIGGKMVVDNYTNTDKKVSNEGKIKITGNLNNGSSIGENFVDETTGVGTYGQLIISGAEANVGKVTSEVKFNSNFNVQTLAIPYTGITAEHVVKEAFKKESLPTGTFLGFNPGANGYDYSRYKNPIFAWNNEIYSLDNLAASDKLNAPATYYALSTFNTNLGGLDNTNLTSLSGTPNKDDISVKVKGYSPKNSKFTNKYGAAYGSYIVDFTQAAPTGWGDFAEEGQGVTSDYGANIFYFGNPYTSNINLEKGEGFFENIIYQEATNNYDESLTVAALEAYSKIAVTTPQGTGDKSLFIRPFQTFGVKVVKKLNEGSPYTFKFTNAMKTFDINSDATNILYNKKQNLVKINQVGLDLYDREGKNTGNRTYVVASNIYEASQKGEGIEIYNISMTKDNTGIYTLQESEEGTIDPDFINSKTYINGVNADKYVGKPIHIVFQNGKGKYTLKARLNKDLENNKNKFYFEDKSTGKIVEVNKDFEYTFDVEGTDKDRFVLYWAKKPQKISEKELAEESSTVFVAEKNGDYVVRFSHPSGSKANVFVYNISGQLMVSKSIDTNKDFVIPIKGNSSVYIVKVVESNGHVTTKKIIK